MSGLSSDSTVGRALHQGAWQSREQLFHDVAVRATGLSDFGHPSYLEGLRRVLYSYDHEARFHTQGKLAMAYQLVGLLTSRLRTKDWFHLQPESASHRIVRPLVITGFRLGLGGAQTRYGVTPDLCSTGKAISGGLPLGVLCGKAEIMDLADPRRRLRMLPFTMQTGTFSSNPVSTGVACAVIAELEKGEIYTRMDAVGTALMEGLVTAMRDAGVPARVCGDPTVFQIWFTDAEPRDHRSVAKADTLRGMRFSDLLLRQGVLKAAEKFFVSGVHTDDDVAQTIAAFRVVAQQLAEDA